MKSMISSEKISFENIILFLFIIVLFVKVKYDYIFFKKAHPLLIYSAKNQRKLLQVIIRQLIHIIR